MTRWPSLIVIARAVAESIPPDKSTTAVSTIGIGMDTEPKGLASGKLTGRAFRSPARIDRPAGPHVDGLPSRDEDRKSTRLNSSHVSISYAVFCLKKKNKQIYQILITNVNM